MKHNFPLYFFDSPEVLNAQVTSIPAKSVPPLQVIADSGGNVANAIDYIDTTGDFIGVYIGPAGKEVLLCIIGNGLSTRAWVIIASHSRVSLRSMTSSAITNGHLTCTFMSA